MLYHGYAPRLTCAQVGQTKQNRLFHEAHRPLWHLGICPHWLDGFAQVSPLWTE